MRRAQVYGVEASSPRIDDGRPALVTTSRTAFATSFFCPMLKRNAAEVERDTKTLSHAAYILKARQPNPSGGDLHELLRLATTYTGLTSRIIEKHIVQIRSRVSRQRC